MPAGRSLWIVTTKLRPVKIEEKPSMKTPATIMMTLVLVVVLYGV